VRTFRSWSLWRVLLLSVAWVVLCVLAVVAWVALQFSGQMIESSGSAGVGAVAVGISELVLAIPVVPPIILFVAWLVARRRNSSTAV
jgi:hypothetical protein